jgi:hypothetical protein
MVKTSLPNDAEQKVKHNNADRKLENGGIQFRRKVIYGDRNNEQDLGESPDKSPPFNVVRVGTARKVYLIDNELRSNVVCGRLYYMINTSESRT